MLFEDKQADPIVLGWKLEYDYILIRGGIKQLISSAALMDLWERITKFSSIYAN